MDRGVDLATAEGRRAALLAMAARRATPGSGTAPAVAARRTWTLPVPDLRPVLAPTGAPFAIVGGVATRLYMQERASPDLDILIDAGDAEVVTAALDGAGAARLGDHPAGGGRWELPPTIVPDVPEAAPAWRALARVTGIEVDAMPRRLDVLAPDAPWVGPALATAQPSPTGLPVVALPYLVVMKLTSGASGDLDDLARLLAEADPGALAAVRAAVQAYRPAASDDLDRLIAAGRRGTIAGAGLGDEAEVGGRA
jgi:hypothetical protein